MVVLLAIAGAIAAVLLARGNEAADQLNQEDLTQVGVATNYKTKATCDAAGFSWSVSTCT